MPPGRTERTPIEQLIVEITAGVNARTLYSTSHPSVAIAAERIANRVDSILAARQRESLTFLIVGDELLLDQQPLRDDTLFQRHFVQSLKRGEVERLTLARGLTGEECRAFIEAMSNRIPPQSSPHLVVGRVDIAFAGAKDEEGGSDGLSVEQIDRARDAFTRFRADRSVALSQLEEVIAGLVESLSRSTRSMLPLANLKDHDEYTFIHSVNVSIMVMAMGRWHGFPGEQVQAIGMAGMLHDIGKLSVPLEVLNKPGKLEGDEWTTMIGHAETGAWALAQASNSPRLAITVAYEHHLRYDRQPNYPILKYPRRPALVSQMTSIADTFDAICTIRPYQKAQSREAALQIIRRRAGTFHDPFLVANFELMLRDLFPPQPQGDAPAMETL